MIVLQILSILGFYAGANVVRAADEEYNMPQKDGHSGEKEVDGTLTFYDMGGPSRNTPSNYTGAICFVPKNAGEQIEITFDELDLGDGIYVYIYDGTIEYPSYNAPVPENPVATLSGQETGTSVLSTTGKLSVLYYSNKYNYSPGAGWKATVKNIVPKDMVYIGLAADQSAIGSSYPGKKGQPILAVNVQADGSLNALEVESLSFDLTGTTSLDEISNLQVYYTGGNGVFSASRAFGDPVASASQSVTVTGTQKLSSGDNWFWLAADVSTDAVPMHKLDASCTSVSVAGEEKVSLPLSPDGNINIDNVVLMSSDAASYNVGTDPISFYDDGGKEGNISEQFEGSVTFRPTTPGSKVQITFTVLDLFNTSTTGLNDVLKIYNGASAEDGTLLRTLLKEAVPLTVKSTAADGALTITLKSTTGIPKPGFEAKVEEFVPSAMSLSEVLLKQDTTGFVCSGDEGQTILRLNLRTQNTEPALSVQKFAFTAAGTTHLPDLTRATVFFTGRDSVFSSSNKVGEVALDGSEAFAVACSQALQEGDNFFWLAYDFALNVAAGNVVDAGCTEVELSDGAHPVSDSNPEGNRTVKNEYVSKVGTYEKTVFGTWTFTHTPASSYSTNYKAEKGDQVVTFVPGTAGRIIELDFSMFSVYYASSTYGTRATFKIYSGKSASAENLLWELSSTDDQEKGPGRLLRSTSADGAMTVVFNANTEYSSSTKKGWLAEVREYEPSPMTVKEITAFQENSGVLKPGSTDQEIIGIEVSTSGDLNPLSLTSIVLDLKGSQEAVAKVKVYYTGQDRTFAVTDLWAESDAPAASVTLNGRSLTLPEGRSYFWVAYDMIAAPEPDLAIDAALTSVTVGGNTVTPVSGDPEGARETKNIYELLSGDNGTITVGNSLVFYDDGGSDNKYSKSFSGNITFVPADPSKVIKLVFKKFYTNSNDELKLYEGSSVKSTYDLKYYGNLNSNLPTPYVSRAADGAVTLSFSSASYSTPTDGWEIEVLSYTPQPLALGDVTVSAANNGLFLKGMKDELILKIEAEVVGDKGAFDIGQFVFNLAGTSDISDIDAVKVYAMDTVPNFDTKHLLGQSSPASSCAIDGNYTAVYPGIFYFWLTYDISQEAQPGNVIKAQLQSINGGVVGDETAASGTVQEGFKGTYTVGVSAEADYATLSEAVAAMSGGIDGPVVFEIENGTYDEAVVIPHIAGASESNTITIKSKSGNYEDVVFAKNTYSEPGYGEEKNGMFTIKGADYLTLEGISLTTTANWPSLLNIKNMSRHVTIRNCSLQAEMSTSYTSGSKLLCTEAVDEANMNSDYLTVEHSVFDGGTYGVYVNGTGFVRLPKQRGLRLLNNRFTDQGSASIYVTKEEEALIDGNEVSNERSNASNFKAIDVVAMQGLVVRNNSVRLATANYASGIYIRRRDDQGTTKEHAFFYNNAVNFTKISGTSASYGINCTDALAYTEVVYNTVRMANESSAATSSPIYVYCTAAKLPVDALVADNLFQNEAGGYAIRVNNALAFGDEALTLSNNVYYTDNAETFAYAGGTIADFEAWKTASGESIAVSEKADFYSETNLALKSAGGMNCASLIDYVTTDINGEPRSGRTPTVGAYEFQLPSTERPVMAAGYPVLKKVTYNSAVWTVKADQTGKVYFLAKNSNEEAPSLQELFVADSLDITKDKELDIQIVGLESKTSYKCYFALSNSNNIESLLISSDIFETEYRPTEVSTFEDAEIGSGTFEDGTARFEGFSVEAVSDGIEGSTKAARIVGERAIVTLTNTAEGLSIGGFFLSSDAPLTITAATVEGEKSKEVASTEGKWIFCNLKDVPAMTEITLTTTGTVFIDDFSGTPEALSLTVTSAEIARGEEAVLDVRSLEGGVMPYAYEWTNSKRETVSTEKELSVRPEAVSEYTLTVTDAWGGKVSSKGLVTVLGTAETATFENLYLDAESYWTGDADSPSNTSVFYSGSYSFSNYYDKSQNYWGGFAYANETSTSFEGIQHQYRSAAGGGFDGSENYTVGYVETYYGNMPKVRIMNNVQGDSIRGVYVTNAAYTKNAMDNGDGMTEGVFALGDWLKLTAKGTDKDGQVRTADFYLADYRSTDHNEHYTLSTWEWFDLASLGKVTEISFSMSSSRNNDWGMTTPAYFCMDDFNGFPVVHEADTVDARLSEAVALPLNDFVSFDEADGTIRYVVETLPDAEIATAVISGSELSVSGVNEGATSLLLSAVQRGRKELVRVPVSVKDYSGVEDAGVDEGTVVYPVPARDVLYLESSMDSGTAEILSVSGQIVGIKEFVAGRTTIDVSGLEEGSYLIRLTDGDRIVIKRFTKVR